MTLPSLAATVKSIFHLYDTIVKEGVVALSSEYSSAGLDVWFKDDIQNALRAVDRANVELCKVVNSPETHLYRQGYEAAIRAISEALGVRYKMINKHDESPTIIDVTP
jgi:hypothetical protein